MHEPYCFDIETLLNGCQPESILVIGRGAEPAVEHYLQQKRLLGKDCRVDRRKANDAIEGLDRRYDLGILTETIEYLDKQDAVRLLSRVRDVNTARFCMSVRIGRTWTGLTSTWSRNELLGMGMILVNTYDGEAGRSLHLYKYDIATYKATPRWLNPDDWANPELWNKYRW